MASLLQNHLVVHSLKVRQVLVLIVVEARGLLAADLLILLRHPIVVRRMVHLYDLATLAGEGIVTLDRHSLRVDGRAGLVLLALRAR